MKKLLTLIGLSMTLSVVAQNTSPTFKSMDFLGDRQGIWITNLTTYYYGDSNVAYSNALGNVVYSGTSNYSTNNTYTNGYMFPATLGTNSNTSFPYAWQDVPSFSDRNGNNSVGGVAIQMHSVGTSSSNLVTFTLAKLTGINNFGQPDYPGILALDKFAFSVLSTNGNVVLATVTNLPANFSQGVAGWRLLSIQTAGSTNANQGVIIDRVSINGYVP